MIPNIIVDQIIKNVKGNESVQVFGMLSLQVSTQETSYVDSLVNPDNLNLTQLLVGTTSNSCVLLKVHDYHLEWGNVIGDKTYGDLLLTVSIQVPIDSEDALIAATYLLNELNMVIDKLDVDVLGRRSVQLKIHDFNLDWEHVYSE